MQSRSSAGIDCLTIVPRLAQGTDFCFLGKNKISVGKGTYARRKDRQRPSKLHYYGPTSMGQINPGLIKTSRQVAPRSTLSVSPSMN
jgi:hypothetical protein